MKAEDAGDFSSILIKLKLYYEKVDLQINMAKSEYLLVGNETIEDLQLDTGMDGIMWVWGGKF